MRKMNQSKYNVSIVTEAELSDFLKPDVTVKRNLSFFLRQILEDFETKTKIVVIGIEIKRNDKGIESILITT